MRAAPKSILVCGNAAGRIAKYAAEYGAGLVVLGSPVDELAQENLQTGTVLPVISSVSCPVLCMLSTREETPVKEKPETAHALAEKPNLEGFVKGHDW